MAMDLTRSYRLDGEKWREVGGRCSFNTGRHVKIEAHQNMSPL